MKVAIIKYNAGNIHSVELALQRLGVQSVLTDKADEIYSADKVIFPGQGEASSAMEYLKNRDLDIVLKNLKQPFLGICLGLQLMCRHSEENDTQALGIFETDVKRFSPKNLKIPQVGWNSVSERQAASFIFYTAIMPSKIIRPLPQPITASITPAPCKKIIIMPFNSILKKAVKTVNIY